MIREIISLVLVGTAALSTSWSVLPAETATEAPVAAMPALPAALSKLKFVQGRPDLSAKYYFFLQSASWCGPCRLAMPHIVAAYEEMKKAGYEVILFSHDRSIEGALELARDENVPFPVALSVDADDAKLPGFVAANGIPLISVVSAEGQLRFSTHPNYLFPNGVWKDIWSWYETPRPCVKEVLPQMSFIQGQPDADARYYIYLESSYTCSPCHKAMPYAVDAYPELKAAGAEIIMCCRDGRATAIQYAKRYNAVFPIASTTDGNAQKLPGFHHAGDFGIPRVIVVNAKGENIWEGHPLRFFTDDQWKQYVKVLKIEN